jgi:hypothetical protein
MARKNDENFCEFSVTRQTRLKQNAMLKMEIILNCVRKMSIMNKNRQQMITEAARAHRESLRRNLQHRLEVARAQGNDKLVRQIEAEAAYLHLM